MTEQDIIDNALLIQVILSDFNAEETISDGFDQMFSNVTSEDKKETPSKTSFKDDLDWDSVSDVGDKIVEDKEEVNFEFPVPSFEDTVGSSKALATIKEDFETKFPSKKKFADKNSARVQLKDI